MFIQNFSSSYLTQNNTEMIFNFKKTNKHKQKQGMIKQNTHFLCYDNKTCKERKNTYTLSSTKIKVQGRFKRHIGLSSFLFSHRLPGKAYFERFLKCFPNNTFQLKNCVICKEKSKKNQENIVIINVILFQRACFVGE